MGACRSLPAVARAAVMLRGNRVVVPVVLSSRTMDRGNRTLDLDPVLRSQLDDANHLVAGELSVPVPAGARGYGTEHPNYRPGPDGAIKAEFGVRGTVAALHALYLCWARWEDWQLEATKQRDFPFDGDVVAMGASGWRATKGTQRFEIVLGRWIAGEVIVGLHFYAAVDAVYQLGKADTPPSLPAVTRPYPAAALETTPLDAPKALVCDRGLVYLSDGDRIRVVDPTTRRIWLLAGGGSETSRDGSPETVRLDGASGLAVDDLGLWIIEKHRGTLRRLVFATDTVSTIARDLSRPIHLALAGGLLYVVGDRANLVAIDPAGASRVVLGDGALAALDRGWEVEGFASAGGSLYAAEGGGIVYSIDRATGQVHKLAETPLRPRGLTADRDALYVGHRGAITRIGIVDGKVEQIAGSPRQPGDKIDGREGVGGIDQAESLAWDGAGGVYFVDDGSLRWLDLRRRHLLTVLDAKRDHG